MFVFEVMFHLNRSAHPVLKLSSRSPLNPFRMFAEVSLLGDNNVAPESCVLKSACFFTNAAFKSPASDALCLCLRLMLRKGPSPLWPQCSFCILATWQKTVLCVSLSPNCGAWELPTWGSKWDRQAFHHCHGCMHLASDSQLERLHQVFKNALCPKHRCRL